MVPSAVLDFQIFNSQSSSTCANTHQRTKFNQNWSNGCGDTAFNDFQNGGCPPSWIF